MPRIFISNASADLSGKRFKAKCETDVSPIKGLTTLLGPERSPRRCSGQVKILRTHESQVTRRPLSRLLSPKRCAARSLHLDWNRSMPTKPLRVFLSYKRHVEPEKTVVLDVHSALSVLASPCSWIPR